MVQSSQGVSTEVTSKPWSTPGHSSPGQADFSSESQGSHSPNYQGNHVRYVEWCNPLCSPKVGFVMRSQWHAVLQLSHSRFSPPDLNQEGRLILLHEDYTTEAVLSVTKASMRRWSAEEISTITGSASHKFTVHASKIRRGIFSQQLCLSAFFLCKILY